MNLPSLRAPVPTKVARALVLAGNLLHSIGASLLATENDELTDKLAAAIAGWDIARAALAAAEHAGTADVDEHQGAAAFVVSPDELEAWRAAHPGAPAVDELRADDADDIDDVVDEHPEWLGFGGFPPNQSGSRL